MKIVRDKARRLTLTAPNLPTAVRGQPFRRWIRADADFDQAVRPRDGPFPSTKVSLSLSSSSIVRASAATDVRSSMPCSSAAVACARGWLDPSGGLWRVTMSREAG
jgi:hypothetical protein